jgi:hypothetical protein
MAAPFIVIPAEAGEPLPHEHDVMAGLVPAIHVFGP